MEPYFKTRNTLSFFDYLTFGSLLLISACVGLYYAIFDKKSQSTIDGYFLGNRRLHPIPVGISLFASFISTITMLGGTAELYTQTTLQYYYEILMIPACILASVTFIPIFQKLQVKSVYEVRVS